MFYNYIIHSITSYSLGQDVHEVIIRFRLNCYLILLDIIASRNGMNYILI